MYIFKFEVFHQEASVETMKLNYLELYVTTTKLKMFCFIIYNETKRKDAEFEKK